MTTQAEKDHLDAVARIGCIVCHVQGRGYVPAAVHHLLSGGRRIGHLATIPLCDPGHHKGAPKDSGEVSRHPTKAQFEDRYGSEAELWQLTNQLIGFTPDAELEHKVLSA